MTARKKVIEEKLREFAVAVIHTADNPSAGADTRLRVVVSELATLLSNVN